MIGLGARRVRYTRQLATGDCGPAVLCMVLAFYGRRLALSRVRAVCRSGRDGMSVRSLIEAGRALGLVPSLVKATPSTLARESCPLVLHWQFTHFVVLEEVRDAEFTVVDPALGRRTLSPSEFGRAFTGIAIAFRPAPSFERCDTLEPLWRRLLRLVRASPVSLRGHVAAVALLLQLVALGVPASVHLIIDLVVDSREPDLLAYIIAGIVIGGACRLALGAVRDWLMLLLAWRIDQGITLDYVARLSRLPLAFFANRRPARLLQHVSGDFSGRSMVMGRLMLVGLDIQLALGFAAILVYYESLIGGTLIALGLIRMAVTTAARRRVEYCAAVQAESANDEDSFFLDSLAQIETLKAVRLEYPALRRLRDKTVRRISASVRQHHAALELGVVNVILDGLGIAFVIWYGGKLVIDGQLSVGTLTAILSLRIMFTSPLESLCQVLPTLELLRSELEQLDDVLAEPLPSSGSRTLPPSSSCRLEAKQVGFQYSAGDAWLLRDIDLAIGPGETILLAGVAGSGKSTLARLLAGLDAPTVGAIELDARRIEDLDEREVRRRVRLMPQSVRFLDASVRDNLRMGAPDVPDAVLWEALEIAELAVKVRSLDQGLDTPLGPDGSCLSKGERQRLALARALAGKPQILILDEFAGGLDAATEGRIQRNLARLPCAKVIVSHRFTMLPRLDRILLLRDGRLQDVSSLPGLLQRLCPEAAREAPVTP
jgi:ABC-type bacteriocin/lantibiotic exporter with double-glycine peptidase domain